MMMILVALILCELLNSDDFSFKVHISTKQLKNLTTLLKT
jgi:hypothetical protein